MYKILIVEQDISTCILLENYFSKNGYIVYYVHSNKKALLALSFFNPDIAIIDYKVLASTEKSLINHFHEFNAHLPLIIISDSTDIRIAVEMIKLGANDYVMKPLFPDEILMVVSKALKEKSKQNSSVQSLPNLLFTDSKEFIGVLEQIALVAPTNYSVIIYGESGSGKEGIALEIHSKSNRAHAPFIPIDCGTLSKELVASELFGHEKGAFTGASEQKIGIFELANGGTVFLDEVANLSYEVQVALLRVIQQRKIRRVGGKRDIAINIRFVVASNDKLWDLSQVGKFREDLFHRFNEFSIELPPLRNRKSDISTYSLFFLAESNEELGKNITGFKPDVIQLFLAYQWPGNLRELKNIVKRATLVETSNVIQLTALPFEMINQFEIKEKQLLGDDYKAPHLLTFILPESQFQHDQVDKEKEYETNNSYVLKKASIGAEYEMILEAIKMVNNNKSKAALLLNIDRKTLYNKMKQYKEYSITKAASKK